MGEGANHVLDCISNCGPRVSVESFHLPSTWPAHEVREISDHRFVFSATAKYWLYFLKGFPSRANPEPPMKAVEK